MNSTGVSAGRQDADLQSVQCPPGVAVAHLGQEVERVLGGVDFRLSQSALGVGQGSLQERLDLVAGERLEGEDLAAADERRIDREKRVLRGRPDQNDDAFLHVRKEDILLRPVEAMDFVDEQDGAPAAVFKLARASASSSRTSLTPVATALTWRKRQRV